MRAAQKGRSRADHRSCQVRRPPRTQPSRRCLRRRHQRRPRRAEGSLYACASAGPRGRNRSPNLSAVRSARDGAKSSFRGRPGHGPRSCGGRRVQQRIEHQLLQPPAFALHGFELLFVRHLRSPALNLLAAEGWLAELVPFRQAHLPLPLPASFSRRILSRVELAPAHARLPKLFQGSREPATENRYCPVGGKCADRLNYDPR